VSVLRERPRVALPCVMRGQQTGPSSGHKKAFQLGNLWLRFLFMAVARSVSARAERHIFARKFEHIQVRTVTAVLSCVSSWVTHGGCRCV